jgi:hypothetical protein
MVRVYRQADHRHYLCKFVQLCQSRERLRMKSGETSRLFIMIVRRDSARSSCVYSVRSRNRCRKQDVGQSVGRCDLPSRFPRTSTQPSRPHFPAIGWPRDRERFTLVRFPEHDQLHADDTTCERPYHDSLVGEISLICDCFFSISPSEDTPLNEHIASLSAVINTENVSQITIGF